MPRFPFWRTKFAITSSSGSYSAWISPRGSNTEEGGTVHEPGRTHIEFSASPERPAMRAPNLAPPGRICQRGSRHLPAHWRYQATARANHAGRPGDSDRGALPRTGGGGRVSGRRREQVAVAGRPRGGGGFPERSQVPSRWNHRGVEITRRGAERAGKTLRLRPFEEPNGHPAAGAGTGEWRGAGLWHTGVEHPDEGRTGLRRERAGR